MVTSQLDGSIGNVFLVTSPPGVPLETFLQRLLGQVGIVDAEPDLALHLTQSQTLTTPSGLWDTTPVSYYGTTVWNGYPNQPAVGIINLPSAGSLGATGTGVVAVIDTGVDPTHPLLQAVLLPGHDFTRNLRSVDTSLSQLSAAQAISNAVYISPPLGYGRLDIGQALAAWCSTTPKC